MNLRLIMLGCTLLSATLSYASTADATPSVAGVSAPTQGQDYVILTINGQQVRKSEVEAIWSSLFPAGTAPQFSTMEETVKQNLLRGVIGEYLLMSKAVEANLEQKPEVKQKLEAMRKKILVDSFLQEKSSSLVTPASVKLEYETQKASTANEQEVRASHILVKTEQEAKALLAKIKAGSPFEEVAKTASVDKASAVSGGDLGYFVKDGAMVPSFSQAAFALEKGAISEPVQSEFGWHIIKLVDKRVRAIKPFAEEKEKIEQKLRANALGDYINSLVESANVQYFNEKGEKLVLTNGTQEHKH
ncbi:MAG: hypothetical protein EAZ74_00815 [Alphaproteobacteria bacterium]|nr:MAG: hypothetical protein EAY76_01970 [Alphaproteobacteria bacterium]TAF15848.1 MAG: hypothetical protein EAZ74_00815 [Alphaproteobacteria bacterium]TAF41121.1 MAG: hypothetical protein EAZ66_01865 [Alphaproteobacteria bacterium]TAF77254.1 MAG: hypothetical protein EAZ52_01600 [Alphaproteobacteria bacterium]